MLLVPVLVWPCLYPLRFSSKHPVKLKFKVKITKHVYCVVISALLGPLLSDVSANRDEVGLAAGQDRTAPVMNGVRETLKAKTLSWIHGPGFP